ncbi:MAG: EamA family transporter [Lentisphaeria bacterium]|nr:EamA family transporter [Lentisphaeria bacterium]
MLNSWWLPTIISAVVMGFYDICKKHSVKDNSVMPALFLATLSGTLFFMLMSAVNGELVSALSCSLPHFLLILLKSIIVSSSWICVYYALRDMPISLATPIRSTSPLWTMIGGIAIFKEIPTLWQAVGMAAILTGYMLISLLGKKEGFSWKSKGMRLIITGTLLGAASAIYDKFLLNTLQLNRQTLQLYFSIDLVFLLGTVWAIRQFFGHRHPFVWKWSIPATGILLIISDYTYFFAVSLSDAPISMISLVRRCSCVVSFFIGAWIFHDKNLKSKSWILLLLLAGTTLLALAH